MTAESLAHFQAVSRTAFAFLITDYAFREVSSPLLPSNPYVVEFTNASISLRVVGESYGTIANIEFISPDQQRVPSQVLEPTWEPGARGKKAKRNKQSSQGQDEQIIAAARRIQERDADILAGDYARLHTAASKWLQALASPRAGA